MIRSCAPLIRQLFDRSSCTYTYLLLDKASKDCVLIDPVFELVERDIEVINGLGGNLKYVINTHVHADHVTGTGKIKNVYQQNGLIVKSVISATSDAKADVLVNHNDIIEFGKNKLLVKSTPGHTPGCVSYILNDATHIFTGDAVLIRGCGRTDFQGGDPGTLYDSVWSHILTLNPSTVIYPGHDYNGRTCTTVEEEKTHNPRLTKSKDDFISLMKNRFDGSKYPEKLDISLPANLKCGVYEDVSEVVSHATK